MEARAAFRVGHLDQTQAYAIVSKYLNHANEKGKEIAKRFGKKYRPISIFAFMR